MKKTIITIALGLTIFAGVASAGAPKPGTFGLGWYSSSAPVGGRVWVTPQVGLDLGLGYADKKALGGDKDRFHVNIGLPVNVVTTEKVNFFIRPGVEIQTNSRTVTTTTGTESKSTTFITADLGAEWFVSDQFSLSVGHGLQFQQVTNATDGSDDWGITALRALSFESIGFHFYFQ